MHAESLPTEIWFEIFSYLHPRENVEAFFNLNRFFNRFASTEYFGVDHYYREDEFTQNPTKTSAEKLRINIIRSITDYRRAKNSLLEFLCRNAEDLVQLRSISIYLQRPTMTQAGVDLIDVLNRLPSLRSIGILLEVPQLDDCQIKDLLITIFSERLMLTKCRLLFSLENLHLSLYQWAGPSSIRYLSVEKISWPNLCAILSQTINLVFLNVSIIGAECEPATFNLPLLREIMLNIDKTPFALLTNICQLAPQMHQFSLRGSFPINDRDYFQKDAWRKLLDPIHFHYVLLGSSTCVENEKVLLREIHASLIENQWFTIRVDGSFLSANIIL